METDDDQGGFLTHTRTNNNMRILYITMALVIAVFFVWIVVIYFTGEAPLNVLIALANEALQVPLSDDATIPVSDQTPDELPVMI